VSNDKAKRGALNHIEHKPTDQIQTEGNAMDIPFINFDFVSGCDATHCKRAKALQTRLLACGDSVGGLSIG
jgi:hypothetical protein